MHITAASTISHQPTFRNKGFSSSLSGLHEPSEILHPDYSPFIPVMARRRMSDVLKMAIVCAVDCLEQAALEQPDAIIVGTSMGCNTFTKNFLDKIIAAHDGLISPTSFIVSTHNTIAGQISLLLGNQQYNMTHTQNSLSFEQALIDGIMCLQEGSANILVGAADEMENALYNMHARLNNPTLHVACGASLFMLSSQKPNIPSIHLVDVRSYGLVDDLTQILSEFLHSNDLSADDVDVLLYACRHQKSVDEWGDMFKHSCLYDYEEVTGCYFTNAAFAMHFSIDMLLCGSHPSFGENIRRVLICNNSIPENLGLILLDIK
jgi:hypothetical protein